MQAKNNFTRRAATNRSDGALRTGGIVAFGVVLVVFIAFAIVFYRAPLGVFRELRTAAAQGDLKTIERLTDLPSLRRNMSSSLNARVKEGLGSADAPGGLTRELLDVLRAGARGATESMVELLVAPRSVAAMLDGSVPGLKRSGEPAAGERILQDGFQGFELYRVVYGRADPQSRPVEVYLARTGMLEWRLVSLRLLDR